MKRRCVMSTLENLVLMQSQRKTLEAEVATLEASQEMFTKLK